MTRKDLEIKYDQIFQQFNGYSLDYDGAYGAQCFDLIQAWNRSWLNCPNWITGDYAYQIYGQLPQFYTSIPNNSATAKPIKGDIVVWEKAYNGYAGHTGIANGAGVAVGQPSDWFDCFEQNDPTGSVCHIKRYSFDHVVGWLRFKTVEAPINYQAMVDQIRTLSSLPADQYKAKVIQIVKG